MSTNGGGPAFPANHFDLADGEHGISMRDYFAAKAMQGELAAMRDSEGDVCGIALDASDETMDRLARHYYRISDAMLKAREAGK